MSVVIVGVIRRKPVLTHASIVCEGMLASVNSVNSVNTATTSAAERKPQTTTGPKTTAYKLKELPLAEVIGEVELRINRLKTFNKFSNSDCSDDLHYLNAATRCGSNPEVNLTM